MQKLLIILAVLFLIILAPALLIALAAPERLGMILLLWSAITAVTMALLWKLLQPHLPGKR